MTAIWPAGPPKLSAAIRAQTFVASFKEMPWSPAEGVSAGVMEDALAVIGPSFCC
jgi:hypothetical protein